MSKLKSLLLIIAGAVLTLPLLSVAAFPPSNTTQGGTGTTTPSGILYGDNGTTLHLNTVNIGSNLTFSGGTLSASGGSNFGYPFTNPTSFGTTTAATTTPLWARLGIYASSTSQFDNATSTKHTIGTLWISGLSNSGLGVDANGLVYNAATTTAGTGLSYLNGQFNNSGVLSISGTSPISCSGTNPGNCSIQVANTSQNGYLTSTDWNTFNTKIGWGQASTTPWSANQFVYLNNNGFMVTAASSTLSLPNTALQNSSLTVTANSPLTGGGTPSLGGSISIGCQTASNLQAGCLSSTDWSTFNSKQGTISVNWPVTLSGATVGFNGLSTSTTPTRGNIPYFSGVNTFDNVATGTITCNQNTSCGTGSYVVGGNLTINGLAFPFNTQTEFATTTAATTTPLWAKLGIYASSTSQFNNSSTTQATLGTLWIPGLTSSGLGVDANGKVYAAATTTAGTGLSYSASTGQFSNSGVLSVSCTTGITCSGTNPASFSINDNALTLAKLPQINANYILGNNTGATANVTSFATSSLFGIGTGGQVVMWSNATNGLVLAATSSSAGGTPGGSDTQVQFNDGGSTFSGADLLTWNKTFKQFTAGTTSANALINAVATIEGTSTKAIPLVVRPFNNSTESLRVNSDGTVGIASTTPWGRLAVNPLAGDASQFVVGSSTQGNASMRITNSGQIAFGTNAPTSGSFIEASSTNLSFRTGTNGTTPFLSVINTRPAGGMAVGLVAGTAGSTFVFDSAGTFNILADTHTNFNNNALGGGTNVQISDVNSTSFYGNEPGGNNGVLNAYDQRTAALGVGARLILAGSYSGAASTPGAGIGAYKENGTAGDYSFANILYARTNGAGITEKARILGSNGFMGIATTTPFAKLSVNPVAGDAAAFVVGSSTATSLMVDNAGNVEVGTTTSTSILGIGVNKGSTNGTTTIRMGKIQYDGYNSAGARICTFINSSNAWAVQAGACTD